MNTYPTQPHFTREDFATDKDYELFIDEDLIDLDNELFAPDEEEEEDEQEDLLKIIMNDFIDWRP